jgi:hypothetical protein
MIESMNKNLLKLIAVIMPCLYAKILAEQRAKHLLAIQRAAEVKRLMAWPNVPKYNGPKFPEIT